MFQHTAARRRLEMYRLGFCVHACFNTQPPEGGWADGAKAMVYDILFQHTAARRRLVFQVDFFVVIGLVSTHSRPKAAG